MYTPAKHSVLRCKRDDDDTKINKMKTEKSNKKNEKNRDEDWGKKGEHVMARKINTYHIDA